MLADHTRAAFPYKPVERPPSSLNQLPLELDGHLHDHSGHDDYDDDGNESAHEAIGALEWPSTTMLIIADIVGIGVLTMGRVFAQLGWFWAVVLLTVFLPLNVYMGRLLARAKEMFPEVESYEALAKKMKFQGEMSSLDVGSVVVWLVQTTFISYVLFTMSGFFLAIVDTLEMVFVEVSLCQLEWSGFAVVILILPSQMRRLRETKVLLWLNFGFICIAIILGISYMIQHMQSHTGAFTTYLVHPDLTLVEFCNGMAKITYAYFGCYLYLEMMAEMRDPSEFSKSLFVAAPFQYVLYLAVGVVGFLYDGAQTKDIIIAEINPKKSPVTFRVASLALLFHILVAFVIKMTVFTRVLYKILTPKLRLLDASSFKQRRVWFILSSSVLALNFTLANAVPLLGKMTSILGALQVPVLGYIMPIVFFVNGQSMLGFKVSTRLKLCFGTIVAFAATLLFVGTASNLRSFHNALQHANITLFECRSEAVIDHYDS